MKHNLLKSVLDSLSKINRNSPVRLNFFILLVLLLLIDRYGKNAESASAAFPEIFALLLKALGLIILVIFAFSLLSVISAYLLCRRRERRDKVIYVQFSYPDRHSDKRVACRIDCNANSPLGGMLKAAPFYDKNYPIPQFALHRASRSKTKNPKKTKSTGETILSLPETRHYKLKSISLIFEDLFRLFSLHRTFKMSEDFIVLPLTGQINSLDAVPRQSKEQVKRTDTVRRQEGEWLHFKDFEPTDDIRRIAWQIYARNKELVVRMPEMMNMYASQIDVYVSFYNEYSGTIDSTGKKLNSMFINDYKRIVWTLFQSLETDKDVVVRYIPDSASEYVFSPELPEILSKLVSMQWHKSVKPDAYFKLNSASICCISPLIPVAALEKAVRFASQGTIFMYANLQESFEKSKITGVIKDIFTSSDESANEISKWKWLFSPLRARIIKNDREIRALFRSEGKELNELKIEN